MAVFSKLVISVVAVTLVLAGCAAQKREETGVCPGKGSVEEAISVLRARREKAIPIKASGQCLLRYHVEGKERKENFPVRLWVSWPDEAYLQGDVAFDATGIVLGSNREEFWFWLRPKEISSYWWGRWSQTGRSGGLVLSPAVMLDAFGAVDVNSGDWSLSHEGVFDVLTQRGERGAALRRVYIEPCDYIVARIEYLNAAGEVVGRAEFAQYEKVSEGFFVAKAIKIIGGARDGGEDSAEIWLASVKATELNDEQRERLFVRPGPRGFAHIYQIIGGDAVELIQE